MNQLSSIILVFLESRDVIYDFYIFCFENGPQPISARVYWIYFLN